MPTVSVIIPTYGHRDYVLATLNSVFAQTFTDYEVIVINDGSPDDTAAVLKPLAESGRIRYFDQKNAGQSATRNRGLELATGEFIALLDDDDLWPADKLAWQVEALRARDAVAVGGGLELIRENAVGEIATVPGFPSQLRPIDFYGRTPFFSPGQVLIRAATLKAIGGFDPAIWGADDLDLWIRLAAAGDFLFDPRIALRYRLHAGNASHAWERMIRNGRRALAKNLPLLPQADRANAAAAGERFLYLAYGSHRIQSIWSVNPSRWTNAARALRHFFKPALRRPRLAAGILKDFVPAAARRFFRPVPKH